MREYRRLFSHRDAVVVLAGMFGWQLAFSFVGIALVAALAEASGSFGVAGTVASLAFLAGVVSIPVHGRLADSFGVAQVAVPLALLASAAFAVIAALCAAGGALWPVVALAAVGGLCRPNLPAFARVLYKRIFDSEADRLTAHAFSGVQGPIAYSVGPLGAGLCLAWLGAPATLAIGAALNALGALAWLWVPSAREHVRPGAGQARPKLKLKEHPMLVRLYAATALQYTAIGATGVAVIAFAVERDRPELVGLVLFVQSASAFCAGVVFTPHAKKTDFARALPWALAGLAACTALMALPFGVGVAFAGVVLMAPFIAIAGPALSYLPVRLAPDSVANQSTALASAMTAAGEGLGRLGCGFAVDWAGWSGGFLFGAGACLLAAVAARGLEATAQPVDADALPILQKV